ncbi:hypothetical protein [Paenibacillus sp. OAS669]|uniref:hypothetical protein n=1 Tax=Paenibacillus sp. OAS669 TaxID=2663821 RepID=UPI001789DC74|nr:hypothetical protein [Paenibacillus sp. OAS669]MBE1446265.1 putative membrane protein [Paenibacillus sp. OAS669]
MGIFIFVFICLFVSGYLFINMFDNTRQTHKAAVRKRIVISFCQAIIISGIIQFIIH